MVKKIISIAVALTMTAALFAGCNSKNPAASASATPVASVSSSSEAPIPQPQKEVTITLWQQAAKVTEATLKMQEKFQIDNPLIKLNIVELPDTGTDALIAAIAAGNAPAAMDMGYPTAMSYIYRNAILPIDDYIAATPDFANFDKTQVEAFAVNDKHYAVPYDKYVMGFFYNKKLFAEAGVTSVPTTWDEFLDTAKKLTMPEKQQYGFGLDAIQWGCWHFEAWVWGAGGDLTKMNPDGTLTLTFTDPAAIKAAEFYRTLKKEKCIQSDGTKKLEDLSKDFALGKSAMIYDSINAGTLTKFVNMGAKAEDIGYFAFPKGPSGKAYTQDGANCWVLPITNEKEIADAGWTYIMYLNSKEELSNTLKEQAEKGALGAQILSRTDVKVSDFGPIDAEMQAIMDASNTISKPEFYGKGAVGPFADDMVSDIFGNTNSDIVKVFQDYQDKAAKAAEDFNKAVLDAKK
jgi:ABC-type glycerol-3-phosphate transport system substrate-binding protein